MKVVLNKLSKELKLKERYVISKNFNKEKGFIPVTEL